MVFDPWRIPVPANDPASRKYAVRTDPGTRETNPQWPWFLTARGWLVDPDYHGAVFCDPPDWWDTPPKDSPRWFKLGPNDTVVDDPDLLTMTTVLIDRENFKLFPWIDDPPTVRDANVRPFSDIASIEALNEVIDLLNKENA